MTLLEKETNGVGTSHDSSTACICHGTRRRRWLEMITKLSQKTKPIEKNKAFLKKKPISKRIPSWKKRPLPKAQTKKEIILGKETNLEEKLVSESNPSPRESHV